MSDRQRPLRPAMIHIHGGIYAIAALPRLTGARTTSFPRFAPWVAMPSASFSATAALAASLKARSTCRLMTAKLSLEGASLAGRLLSADLVIECFPRA